MVHCYGIVKKPYIKERVNENSISCNLTMGPEIPFTVEVLLEAMRKYSFWELDRRYCICFPIKMPYNRTSCSNLCRPSRCNICCQRIKDAYCKTLSDRFHSWNWLPDRPFVGHNYRKMVFTTEHLEYYLAITLERLGYDVMYDYDLKDLFTQLNLTVFIDPGSVTMYMKDGCTVKRFDPAVDDPKTVDFSGMLTVHPPHCTRAANRKGTGMHPQCDECDKANSQKEEDPDARSIYDEVD